MASRGYGRGTIYQRASDSLWIGRIDVSQSPRKRVVFSGKDQATVEAKMDTWLAEHMPHRLDPQPTNGRREHMLRAKSIATHTAAEWRVKEAAANGLCYYCERPVDIGGVKDHIVPVSRGGSDGIDNVVLACWDCNDAKRDMDAEAFIEWARATGFFEKPQHVTVMAGGRNRRISPEMAALMRIPRAERGALLNAGKLAERVREEMARS